jgi:hypothetical protein
MVSSNSPEVSSGSIGSLQSQPRALQTTGQLGDDRGHSDLAAGERPGSAPIAAFNH